MHNVHLKSKRPDQLFGLKLQVKRPFWTWSLVEHQRMLSFATDSRTTVTLGLAQLKMHPFWCFQSSQATWITKGLNPLFISLGIFLRAKHHQLENRVSEGCKFIHEGKFWTLNYIHGFAPLRKILLAIAACNVL